jgi:transcriptional regulator with GAF, ATPase, and Fis domain
MDDFEFADLLAHTMSDLIERVTHPSADIDATLYGVTTAAVELIDGVDSADVLMITDPDHYQSVAATSPLPSKLDAFQQESQDGPCVVAADGDPVVRCDDLRTDGRWPYFAKSAVSVGVHSVMSYQLYTDGTGMGALNLFGSRPGVFGNEDEALGAMLATHAALALMAQNKERQFQSALASRDLIGQAKGMIMERFQVDSVRAFQLLTAMSQNSNTRVVEVAAEIVERGANLQLQ